MLVSKPVRAWGRTNPPGSPRKEAMDRSQAPVAQQSVAEPKTTMLVRAGLATPAEPLTLPGKALVASCSWVAVANPTSPETAVRVQNRLAARLERPGQDVRQQSTAMTSSRTMSWVN